jgi:hypothetical protein
LAGHRCIVLLHAFKELRPVRTAENSRSLDPVATSSSQIPKPGSTTPSEHPLPPAIGGPTMNHHERDLDPVPVHPGDAVDHLERLVGDDPEVALLLAQERLRVRVTDGMRRARQLRGLSQADLAERMGISQGRVSRSRAFTTTAGSTRWRPTCTPSARSCSWRSRWGTS